MGGEYSQAWSELRGFALASPRPGVQQIVFVDTETGELNERRLGIDGVVRPV